MLKVIQITDCHLLPSGETVFGSNPETRLRACIADINRNHPDAALCVLTGDLAHHADPRAYAILSNCLRELVIPYRLMMGNHDDRAALRAAFPEVQMDEHGFVQSTFVTPEARLLFLDTTEPGVHTGAYCERRRAWLKGRLDEHSSGTPDYLFMHHPPFAIELPHIDQYVMAETDASALGDLLRQRRAPRHIFFGHVHRPVCGSWLGIPFSALRGTNHQSWLDFHAVKENICSLEPPAYAVIFIGPDRTIVHFHDYMDDTPKYVYDPSAPVEHQVRPLVSIG
ncbi:phosphodiesterase [Bradyrhizobium sp. LHD-71]|uniref:phosphodiesterase n=1 Tax=Bradyrhizobium sp. LHD-71 TaxID=3072141 RepID=UPI00280F7EA2|nr:phosphodiesterase [Bradyrhizobium sp. LHD-71]MDQ8726839.1 phosphodiesterase [Bradyrhizobium sp. LHD-71]